VFAVRDSLGNLWSCFGRVVTLLSAIPIQGQLSQNVRLRALNKFRVRSRSLLIATDVAARGLDMRFSRPRSASQVGPGCRTRRRTSFSQSPGPQRQIRFTPVMEPFTLKVAADARPADPVPSVPLFTGTG
jgi:hypothetical protein